MNMKIAFPTNDGLSFCSDFSQSKAFLILTCELGEITGEEMRWNKTNDVIFNSDLFLTPINDCQVVMANDIGPLFTGLLRGKKKDIVLTQESIITNAYVHYLENSLRKEANTCCCP